jgi:parvulin-like peptidyl-prolyl isomerase
MKTTWLAWCGLVSLASAGLVSLSWAQVPNGPPPSPNARAPVATAPVATRPAATRPASKPTNMDRPPTPPPIVAAPPSAPPAQPPTAPLQPSPAVEPGQPRGAVAARVLARVNGQPILFEEVLNACALDLETIRPQVPDAQWSAVQEEFMHKKLEEMIDVEVLLQDASHRFPPKVLESVAEMAAKEFDRRVLVQMRQKLKIASDADFKRRFESQGYSLEEMRRQWSRTGLAMEYLRNILKDSVDQIDRQDMLDYYKANAKEFSRPETLTWQHIFLDVTQFVSRHDARRQAEQLHALVFAMQKREDFAALALRYSHSADRYQKGENVDPPGQIRPPEVLEALLKLSPGQTAPIIETEAGFHVVKLVAHQQAGLVPFETVCQDIKNKLQNKRFQEEMTKFTKRLRAKAYVENLAGN